MKKLFATLFMLVLTASTFAYDFSAVSESGQTLYYNYLNDHEVEVTPPNNANGGCWLGYTKPTGNLIIPSTVEYEGVSYTVTSIGNRAFMECSDISDVEIPNTVVSIQKQAFYKAGLTSLEIPNSVNLINGSAFFGCTHLLSLTIGSSVSAIGGNAFTGCESLQVIHCNTPTPPGSVLPTSSYYNEIFTWVPYGIPVYVSCLSLNQFYSNPAWNRFTNLIGVFVGVPELNLICNVPGFGTAEIISLPEDCDHHTATVRAIPNPGHEFSYWRKGIEMVSFSPEYTFVLDQNTTLIACFDNEPIVYDSIVIPDHVIGRVFDNNGQVTDEFSSEFIYNSDGQLIRYYSLQITPAIVSDFAFVDYPTILSGFHTDFDFPDDYDDCSETVLYTYYDNNRIKSIMEYDNYGLNSTDNYYYDENWHIIKIEKISPQGSCYKRNLYEYLDNFRTRIDSYYYGYPTMLLKSQTTCHYNERQQILSSQVDTYNDDGVITSQKRDIYSYNLNNKTENIIAQTLTDGEWINTDITHFVYDDKNRVVEYQTGSWSAEQEEWNISHKVVYDYHDAEQKLYISFLEKSDDEWPWYCYTNQPIFYEPELKPWQKAISNYNSSTITYHRINQFEIDVHYTMKEKEDDFPGQSEWYYEIKWDNGDITYQHLEYAADTTIGTSRPKIIIRSNTQYDRDAHTEVTHEYILEENNKVYWWNKELEEFTLLYDYTAETDDEWEIKVGTEAITVHVDSIGLFEYEGETKKVLHISDIGNVFNGDIVVGYGHMTSFFPEKLMRHASDFTVNGLRCYWVGDALLYHNGDEDCDAVYSEIHGIDEDGPSTGSGTFTVYPNPTSGVLTVSVRLPQCDSPTTGQTEYQISNLMGQTLLQGRISAETQQIDISTLPAGMYFISVGKQTEKFVVR